MINDNWLRKGLNIGLMSVLLGATAAGCGVSKRQLYNFDKIDEQPIVFRSPNPYSGIQPEYPLLPGHWEEPTDKQFEGKTLSMDALLKKLRKIKNGKATRYLDYQPYMSSDESGVSFGENLTKDGYKPWDQNALIVCVKKATLKYFNHVTFVRIEFEKSDENGQINDLYVTQLIPLKMGYFVEAPLMAYSTQQGTFDSEGHGFSSEAMTFNYPAGTTTQGQTTPMPVGIYGVTPRKIEELVSLVEDIYQQKTQK